MAGPWLGEGAAEEDAAGDEATPEEEAMGAWEDDGAADEFVGLELVFSE